MILFDTLVEGFTLVLELVYSLYFYAKKSLSSFFVFFWRFAYDYANRKYSLMTESISFLNFGYKDGASHSNSAIDDSLKEKRDQLQKVLPSNFQEFWCSAQLYAAILSRYEGDLNNKYILEVGCGRGGGCAVIHALCSPSRYLGIDLSPEAISTCRMFNKGKQNREFAVGDSMQLMETLPANEADIILNVESAHCYPNLSMFIQGVAYCLKQGGQFLFADVCPGREWDDIRSILRENKMRIKSEYDITPNVLKSLREDIAPALHKMNMSSTRSLLEKPIMWIVSTQTVAAPRRLMESGIAQYRLLVCEKN